MKRYVMVVVFFVVTTAWGSRTRAVEIVFDPTNLGANVDAVLNQLEVISLLAEQIQNQLRMLRNWRFTRLEEVLASMQSIQDAVADVAALDLANLYPIDRSPALIVNTNQREERYRQWLQSQRTALIHAQALQNRTVSEMPVTQQRVMEYVQRANQAPGQTAVLQASNETLATFAGQLQTLQAIDLSQTRMELEDEAQQQAEAAFREQRRVALMQDWPVIDTTSFHQPIAARAILVEINQGHPSRKTR